MGGTSPVLDERHHAESHTVSLKVESRRTGEMFRIWTGICYSDISPLEVFFRKDHNLLVPSLTPHSTCWENLLIWTRWALPDNCGSSYSVCFQASSRSMEGRRWEATFPLKENNPKGNKEQVVALGKKKSSIWDVRYLIPSNSSIKSSFIDLAFKWGQL